MCARVCACVCTIAEGSQLSTCLYIHVNHQLQWLIFVVDLHVLLVYIQGWMCVSTCACCALPPPSFEIESGSSFLRGVRVSLATVSPDSKDSVSHWLVWLISCGLYAPPPLPHRAIAAASQNGQTTHQVMEFVLLQNVALRILFRSYGCFSV